MEGGLFHKKTASHHGESDPYVIAGPVFATCNGLAHGLRVWAHQHYARSGLDIAPELHSPGENGWGLGKLVGVLLGCCFQSSSKNMAVISV